MIPITLVPALIVSTLLTVVVLYLMWDIRRQERRDGRKP
jgi:hypothetical protein